MSRDLPEKFRRCESIYDNSYHNDILSVYSYHCGQKHGNKCQYSLLEILVKNIPNINLLKL